MGIYRISRNIEASIIDQLKTWFDADWTGVNCEKSFARIYDIDLPSVCVRCGISDHARAELGGVSTIRTAQVLLDVFGTSDGNRLDLKDYIISKIKGGLVYYEYTITNGVVDSGDKVENGRIRIINIDDTPVNFDVDRNTLDEHDRFRHLLTLEISLGRVEE